MTLAELQAEVISLTARPDLVDQTLRAVRAATQRAHSLDYWRRDLIDVAISFDSTEYLQTVDVYELLPNFRALKYVRKPSDRLLEIIEPEDLFNYFNYERTDVCYMAGSELKIRSSAPIELISLGYYSHPVVTSEGWDSWIAEEFPQIIIVEAAASICRQIGYVELSAEYSRQGKELFLHMQRTAVDAVGN